MSKLVNLALITLLFGLSLQGIAQTCKANLDNLDFWTASISENGQTVCSYRYCYYGCISKSYTLSGHYRPLRGPWIMQEGGYKCDGSSGGCEFISK